MSCSRSSDTVEDAGGRKMASKPLTLAQLDRAEGMRVDDVRTYESRGLLPRARRQRGRSGLVAYHQEHVERLRFIRRAIECGFSLDGIAQILNPTGLVTCNDIYQIASRQLRRLRHLKGAGAPCPTTLKELMDTCPRQVAPGKIGGHTMTASKWDRWLMPAWVVTSLACIPTEPHCLRWNFAAKSNVILFP